MATLGAAPRAATVGVTSTPTDEKSVNQNVNIKNKFEGDRTGQQKSAGAMDKATDSAMSEMVRATVFSR